MKISHSAFSQLNHVFLLFILLQPLLDLFTSLSLRLIGNDLTFGLLIRVLFLGAAGLYLVLVRNQEQKKNLIYFTLVVVLFLLNIVINYTSKPIFLPMEEGKFLIKIIYFNVALCLYYVLFTTTDKSLWRESALRYVAYAVFLIGALMTAAGLTGTGFASYEGGKMGHVGWFYAGNEIGAIMAIGIPVCLLLAIKKSKWYWLLLLCVGYGLLALGTKVGLGAIVITLLIGLVFTVLHVWRFGKASTNDLPKSRIVILAVLLVGTILITPFTPLAHNMNMHLSWLGINYEEEEVIEAPVVTEEQVQNIVYSGREKYWEDYQAYFSEAPLSQKLFGMGYAGNYNEEAKMIEMDFHDIFYSLGIIGSVLYFGPFLYMVYQLVRTLIKRFSFYLDIENALVSAGILLGLGISFTAGHVLTAPGVSLYLAVLVAFLAAKAKRELES
ncbi:O-antigen ligase family protein [Cytobacillus purgationiresistens]|uniref:O-antigen ligase family protein n=1 Tax=Cytobacillus purgationiresistens TaxID=863449 RepID=A0ABU0ACZ0_9BACI|nr:O-antigen ligase family protein [Cytobacillus purgationiresistens]MDQ0269113.1 hypothetical protein [Cytobacillus purgationiresistens]